MIRKLTSLAFLVAFVFATPAVAGDKPAATLYKTPQCGCCENYADYMRDNGFEVTVKPTHDLSLIKRRYNVPENYLLYVDPKIISIGESATFRGKYNVKRPMTEQDIAHILDRIPHLPDGTVRVAASKFLDGIPKGPFLYEGRRDDDVNDRIRHDNRRELRGLRILAAFLNHTDTKAGNALDMYDPETGILTHHLIDFSSTLGSGSRGVASPSAVRNTRR